MPRRRAKVKTKDGMRGKGDLSFHKKISWEGQYASSAPGANASNAEQVSCCKILLESSRTGLQDVQDKDSPQCLFLTETHLALRNLSLAAQVGSNGMLDCFVPSRLGQKLTTKTARRSKQDVQVLRLLFVEGHV